MDSRGKVLIICNYRKLEAEIIAEKIGICLRRCGYEAIFISNDIPDDCSELGKIELIITLGGDGTVLSAARKFSYKNIPILALNFGTIGFITEIEKECWEKALKTFLEGTYICKEHMMLDVCVMRKGKLVFESSVLNEGIINSPDSKLLGLSVKIDDIVFGKYMADGLIVSTTTGSTAYSSAAGGPIVYPGMETVIITPVCPYSFIARPVVVSPDKKVLVCMENKNNSNVVLVLDGQEKVALKLDDTVIFRRSGRRVKIITLPGEESRFYSKLRNRMSLRGADF